MKTPPKTYFQFPLCALTYGKRVQERLEAIIAYGTVEAGKVRWRKMANAERARYYEYWRVNRRKLSNGFNPKDENHIAAVIGENLIGIILGDFSKFMIRYYNLWTFVSEFQSRNGPDPLVRLRRDLVFDARDKKGLTYSQLAVLAAIYSVIGDKRHPVRITRNTILRRALGFKSAAVYLREHDSSRDFLRFSEWGLRKTIENLHAAKFFARALYGRRLTYYSSRLSHDDLQKSVIKRHTYRQAFKAVRRAEDEEMTATIRNRRAALAVNSTPALPVPVKPPPT